MSLLEWLLALLTLCLWGGAVGWFFWTAIKRIWARRGRPRPWDGF